ncbi:MAG: hypothetical protein C5B51_02395 [Terriglobia bacterium]|nr:MAG: hypothetical protein C5B51_02395 [Terriglobia bacterium]
MTHGKRYGPLFVLFVISTAAAHAQWLDYREPGIPRTTDGRANLTAPAPKGLDGKPDLSGVWRHETTGTAEMKRLFGKLAEEAEKVDVPGMEISSVHKYGLDLLVDFQPEETLLRPAAKEQLQRNRKLAESLCGAGDSFPVGFPLAGLLSEPIKIVQSPRITMVLYEVGNAHRQIHTDGRKLPEEFDLPAFQGYSAGHWEGDTLVVETAGFNDKTWLDVGGHTHSDALRVTERFRRRDFGHMDYEVTFDDPKMYTKPFTVKIPHQLLPDSDIFEMYSENEKDCKHIGKR